MAKPEALSESDVQDLLKSKKVRSLIAKTYGADAKTRLAQFKRGEVDEFLDLFEDYKWELSEGGKGESIEAAAPDDDVFEIQIRCVGKIYWIHAAEFDDICYFHSFEDAYVHAVMNYEPFIGELASRKEDEEDE